MKLSRDTTLDKKLPTIGYHYAPAGADKISTTNLKCTPYNEYAPKIKKIKKGSTIITVCYGFNKKLTLSRVLPLKDAQITGITILKKAKVSLYNATMLTVNETTHTRLNNIRKASYTIQDSGGFQLWSGVEDFLDPKLIKNKHTLWADSGVGLDLPLSGCSDEKVFLAGAKMLAANNQVMKSNKYNLMNVSHGGTLKGREKWLNIVLEDPQTSMCIAGLRATAMQQNISGVGDRISPVAFISHVLFTILKTQKYYQHYHVLGVATGWQMFLLSLVAHNLGKTITSDSATAQLSAKSGFFLESDSIKSLGRIPKSVRQSYCNCEACNLVGNKYWFYVVDQLTMLHNLYSLIDCAETANRYAEYAIKNNVSFSDITTVVLGSTSSTKHTDKAIFEAVKLVKTTDYKKLKEVSVFTTPTTLFTQKDELIQTRKVLKKYGEYYGTSFFTP